MAFERLFFPLHDSLVNLQVRIEGEESQVPWCGHTKAPSLRRSVECVLSWILDVIGTMKRRPRVSAFLLLATIIALGALTVVGQEAWQSPQEPWRRRPRRDRASELPEANQDYRGRFVFTRIRYSAGLAGGFRRRGRSSWSHDYPRADQHLSKLLSELTTMGVELEGTNVFELDNADLFQFPVAYMAEPGFWTMSEEEAQGVRAYLLKGGFLIFDDFVRDDWYNLETQLQRVLPEYRPIELDVDHPIFHSFFDMEGDTIYVPHPYRNVKPIYYGLFEDNDPTKRMLAIVNYNNDIAEYWEWSDTGWLPIDLTNDAYKLGINYVIYAMTH